MRFGKNNIPFISIWMVTYNHEDYIVKAVESIMMQKTSFKYTLFIGEDCSTDKTRSICIDLKEKYPNKIELYLQNKNVGAIRNAKSIYTACFESGADYVAMLEGDDYWTDPLKLQKQVEFLEDNPSFSLVAGGYTCKRENTEEDVLIGDRSLFNQINEYGFEFELDVFNKMWVFKTLTIVFRNNLDFVKLTTKYNYFRDAHLFYHILKNGKGFYFQQVFGVYNIHEGGVHSLIGEIQQAKIAYKVYRELYFNNDKDHILREKYFNCTLTAIVLYDKGKYITGLMLVKKFSEFLQLHKTLLKVLCKL